MAGKGTGYRVAAGRGLCRHGQDIGEARHLRQDEGVMRHGPVQATSASVI